MVRIKRREDIILSSQIASFLVPLKVYIPYNNEEDILVKVNDEVLMYQPVIKDDDNYISSPVSGTFIGIDEKNTVDGKKLFLVIKNNFKEEKETKKGIKTPFKELTISEFINTLNKYNVESYEKNNHLITKDINDSRTLIINTIENDLYTVNQNIILSDNLIQILDTIDYVAHTLKIKDIHLLINNKNTNIINSIFETIGSYPNIKVHLINNDYPFLISKFLKTTQYKNELVINVLCLFAIYKAFCESCEISTTYFTLAGNAINESKVINTKNGSSLLEIIKNMKINIANDFEIILGGLMSGVNIANTDIVITKDISSIFIMKKEEIIEYSCISCGACVKYCPINNNPKYVMDNPNKRMSKLQQKRCLNCNLCSYICPAFINLHKFMKAGDKNE